MSKVKRRCPKVNERMRNVFLSSGKTVTELSKQLSCSRSALYGWLYYDMVPDAIGIMQFCAALNVSADYILTGKINGKVQEVC